MDNLEITGTVWVQVITSGGRYFIGDVDVNRESLVQRTSRGFAGSQVFPATVRVILEPATVKEA